MVRRDCLFVSDLHGRTGRLVALAQAIAARRPRAVFLGGDLLARTGEPAGIIDTFARVRCELGDAYPRVFLIFGNDDPRALEREIVDAHDGALWEHAHATRFTWEDWTVFGYAYVPPTPFQLKDWERYDVSRYVDPGCVSPEDGRRTVDVDAHAVRHGTIERDLAALAPEPESLARSLWLFHSPPHKTALDRAALDGQFVDHVPLDVHVGSIAIRRFIERRQPAITLHGHIHESARLTGKWMDRIGETIMLSAAHDGPELALVSFDRDQPADAVRELLPASV